MADIQKDAVEQAAHSLSGTNKRVMPLRIDVTQEAIRYRSPEGSRTQFRQAPHRL
jgi:hypothetical protein